MMKRESSDMNSMRPKIGKIWFVVGFGTGLILLTLFFAPIFEFYYSSNSKTTATTPIQSSNQSLDSYYPVTKVTVQKGTSNYTYYMYLATSISQQERGYMNVTSFGDCRGNSPCLGMLFYFQNYTALCFWMENTYMPMKQIWANNTGSVTYVYNATPFSTNTICAYGRMVLETPLSLNITPGDRVIANVS